MIRRFQFSMLLSILFIINLIAQPVKRVVSLAPSITKNIYSLGAQIKLVGCTNYCKTNKEDNVKVIANAVQVNMEQLYSLKPDLVLAMGLTSPETFDMLKKLGLKYVKFETPKNFEEICQQYIETGKLLGCEYRAKQDVEKEKFKLESLKLKIPKGKTPQIFIELGVKPLFAVIPNTFMHDYIIAIKGINIATDASTGLISRENVLMKNPDAIFITTMGVPDLEEINNWKKYKQLAAVKTNKIFTLDSDMACSPCPESYTNTVKKMIELLYGK
jgi:ABC-type Fe3+-hydroxamate transport system substrate-binding protein